MTAMPLGLDTPSTFGIVLFVLGPSFLQGLEMGLDETAAAYRTWYIGIWCIFLSGLLKLTLAPFTEWVRRVVPRAGLLGSLAAIALVLISFLPLMEILGHPLPGMLALVIVLTSLIARRWLRAQKGAVVLRADSFVTLAGLAAAGAGRAVLPVILGDRWPGLERQFLPEDLPDTPVWVASHVDYAKSGRLRRVRRLLVEAIAAEEGALLGVGG